jgi:hypothetical protein
MFRKLNWTGDVSHIMMKSSANQQKKRGTTFLTSVVLLTLLCLSRPALSQVGILGNWETGTSHTKESGTNRALIFIAHAEHSSTVTLNSVTYGGQSMTKIIDQSVGAGYSANVTAFILDEAGIDAATSSTFNPSWSAAPENTGYASVFLSDVNQTDPIGDSDKNGFESSTQNITTNPLSTGDGDMVFVGATCGNTGDYTVNNGFTEAYEHDMGSSTGTDGYKSATGADETPSVTHTNVNRQVIIGFVVQAAPPDPNKATNPNPGNGASNVSVSAGLSWDAPTAYTPTSYDVYFGTNPTAHSNPKNTVYTTSYDPPGDLAEGTYYYWAVDCNDNGTIYTGYPWSFTTEGGYCGDGICSDEEDCWACEADCGACVDDPIWQVDARCFLDGPSGAFDDISVKDPTIVYYGGKWHLFYTGRDVGVGGNYRMGYASAPTMPELNNATRHYLSSLNGGSYFCAPQVFWFVERSLWYLIYQSGLGPTFSTNTDISDPNGWAAGISMGFSGGTVDYWCISDGSYVYCFYSPLGTTILARRTTVEDFPYNWSAAWTAATETFEAVHVYKNLADGKFYMMVEDVSRHFELWTASDLGGTWTKLAENWAHGNQLVDTADHWTDQVSHGEIIRAGVDEKLEINSINRCEILIQGVVDGSYGDYGNIPYDLGIIRRQSPAGPADLNLDCNVDFKDFAVLAGQWLQAPGVPSADIAPLGGDGIVDMNDLALLVDSWLWGN